MALLGFNKSKAYLVGISNYASPIKRLSTPVKDIDAIAECLYDFDAVTKEADLTRPHFEAFLEKMISEANSSDTDRVLFYFAGHGTTINNTRGPQGFIILKNDEADENSGNYKIADLIDKLNELTCKHLLIVLDCCFAGAVQWDIIKRSAGRKNEEKITDPLYRMFSGNNAWQIITSAAANQEALDTVENPVKKFWGDSLRDETQYNSPFAIQLINALKGINRQDYFNGNIITTTRLYSYISENLYQQLANEAINHEQVPGLFSLLKHKNGQFIFSFKNEEPIFAKTPEFENPYKGFDSYTEKDSELFFGRDKLISDFKNNIQHYNNFFIAGPSGIGKSSLVKAGFVPLLLPGSNNEIFHLFRPATFDFNETDIWKERLCSQNGDKHILFFDQFEEALTLEAGNQKKLAEIIECGRSSSSTFVFIAIRSDKSKRILENKLFNWDRFKTISVPFPTSTDIEDIIIKPALRHATVIRAVANENKSEKDIDIKEDGSFINTIIQSYAEPGSLPFLSTALHEWFKSVNGLDDPRLLKEDTWGSSGSIEEVFNAKMKRIENEVADKYVFRRLMFRLLDYFENSPVRKQLAQKYTKPEDKALLKILEDERIIRYPDDKAEDDPERLIEFAHDSIIEKWLVHQDWFKDRVKKARNNIPDLVRAQNHLVPDVMIWQDACKKEGFINKLKAKRELWNHEEELPKIKRDIQADDKADNIWEHIRSTFWSASTFKIAPVTYFTPPEIDFIQQSVKRNKVGAKIIHRIWILITLMSAVALGLIYRSNLVAKRQANVNLARSYADKSSNVGETEALYLLKEAEKLNPNDPYIAAKLNELLNERDYIGNPFAVAVTNIEQSLSKITPGTSKNKLHLYYNSLDSIEWDYTATGKQASLQDNSSGRIRKTSLRNNKLVVEHGISDTIKFSGETIADYKVSESQDSIYIIVQPDESSSISKLYCYVIDPHTKVLTKKKTSNLNYGSPEFSPQKKYIYFNIDKNQDYQICFYNLQGDSVSAISHEAASQSVFRFNSREDKVMISFLNPEQGHSFSYSLGLIDLELRKLLFSTTPPLDFDDNFLFKNDTTAIYYAGTRDLSGVTYISYTEYNTQTGIERNKNIIAPNKLIFSGSFTPVNNIMGILLFNKVSKKLCLADSLKYTFLNYDGEYIGCETVYNRSKTLLLIKSKQANLFIYTLYNITQTPELIHKSSFSFQLKNVFCVGDLSFLAIEFNNRMLAIFDLTTKLKMKNEVGRKTSSYTGFVEISSDSFALYTAYNIYPFWGNVSYPDTLLNVLRTKKGLAFCNGYDELDDGMFEDSVFLFNCRTGKFTHVKSDDDKLKVLSQVSGFTFKKSDDSAFINLGKRGWQLVYPGQSSEGYDYFSILLNSPNYFFNYPSFIKIGYGNLILCTAEKDHVFNSIENSTPFSDFSYIDMPTDSIVTGNLFDSALRSRRFFRWNVNTNKVSFAPFSPTNNSPYFSIPKTSQILYAEDNKVMLYDFNKQDTLYTNVKKNTIENLFLLSDGLRYVSVDAQGNLYSEFLPQKIKEAAYKIKSPELGYLKIN